MLDYARKSSGGRPAASETEKYKWSKILKMLDNLENAKNSYIMLKDLEKEEKKAENLKL